MKNCKVDKTNAFNKFCSGILCAPEWEKERNTQHAHSIAYWCNKMAWSKRFIPKFFRHSSRDIVRMKWRYYRVGLYTEKKRSHWLKQWPIRKGLGDKKRRVVIGWRCNLDFVETLEQSTNGKFKRFRRCSRSKRILFLCREEDSEIWWKSL